MNYTLDFDDTQTLINALHMNEVNTIERFRYSKPQAQMNDLKDCAKAYEEANTLLQMEKQQSGSPGKDNSQIQNVWQAVRAGILFSYETIKNFKLRAEYLRKMNDAIESLGYDPQLGVFKNADADIESVDPNEDLFYKINDSIKEWANKTSDVWGNTVAYKKKTFMDFMKDKNVNLETYVVKNAGKDQLQILAYMRYFGTALIIFTLGVIVWQLVEAQDKKEAGAEIIISVGGALGGGFLGEVGGIMFFGWLIGDIGTVIGGILGGLVGAFIGGIAADSLFDAMMEAFFYTPQLDQLTGTLFSGPIMYELTLPDNMSLSGNLTGKL